MTCEGMQIVTPHLVKWHEAAFSFPDMSSSRRRTLDSSSSSSSSQEGEEVESSSPTKGVSKPGRVLASSSESEAEVATKKRARPTRRHSAAPKHKLKPHVVVRSVSSSEDEPNSRKRRASRAVGTKSRRVLSSDDSDALEEGESSDFINDDDKDVESDVESSGSDSSTSSSFPADGTSDVEDLYFAQTSMTDDDAFAAFIQWITSSLIDPSFLQAVRRDGYFQTARRRIENNLGSIRDSNCRSNAWKEDVRKNFDSLLSWRAMSLDRTSKKVYPTCEVCGRKAHPSAHVVSLSGVRYDAKRLWQGNPDPSSGLPLRAMQVFEENDKIWKDGQKPASDGVVAGVVHVTYYMGRDCFEASQLYHELLHYCMMLYIKIRRKLVKEFGEELQRKSPEALKQQLCFILDDHLFIRRNFNGYCSLLEAGRSRIR